MNLRVYNAKDKLRETIDAMSYIRTREELNKLFGEALKEILEYESALREEIKCDKLSPSEGKAILNSIFGIRNKK